MIALLGSSSCIPDDDLETALSSIGLGCAFQSILNFTGSNKNRKDDQDVTYKTDNAEGGDNIIGEVELPPLYSQHVMPLNEEQRYSTLGSGDATELAIASVGIKMSVTALAATSAVAATNIKSSTAAGETETDDPLP